MSNTPKEITNVADAAKVQESLIEYPCIFPIKVMGKNVDGFLDAMTHVATSFDPTFDPKTVELRPSSSAHYLGITLSINAVSREQLDELYRTLSTHPMVKVVL
jgi:putative lipoic acid-binding regulatory protein